MAIDKSFGQPPVDPLMDGSGVEVDIGIDTSPVQGDFTVTELEDGGAEVDLSPMALQPDTSGIPFDANLAEYVSESELQRVSSELISLYEKDELARKDWSDTYKEGLDLLGLKIETRTEPWTGACGITHPLLAEAVVRFQSQQIGEMFPASGPTRTKIIGIEDKELIKQATRVQDFMNYQLTEVMEEYRGETDKMLFNLPMAGSAFRKVYYDETLKRPVSDFVPAEDLVVGSGTKSLTTCRRLTHINHTDPNDIRKMQVSGFYRSLPTHEDPPDIGEIQEKKEDITGVHGRYEDGELVTLLEIQADLDLEGFEDYAKVDSFLPEGTPTGIFLPYIVTIDKSRGEVLAIRRNWLEKDTEKKRRQHFTHYEYIPGIGFYGLGLIHLIGGIAKGSTSILRQLVDAGTLSNLPGGFKARGMRVKGDQTPVAAGEWRDVDVPAGKISDNLFPLPYGEPSQVLAALLGSIVEEGRRFASLTDVNISSMNNEAPVGTTLALLERNLKVMTAISARIHAALRLELKILSSIIADHYIEYPYLVDDPNAKLYMDFDGRVDVLPVSDPNSSTMSQRIMTMQTALQLAERAPHLYKGMDVLHRRMLHALEIQDVEEIIPSADDIKMLDPVTENQNMLNMIPVKAFPMQDQEAHIQTHMMGMQDPKVVAMMESFPNAPAIQGAAMAHITEHLAFKYRRDIERNMGITLPPMDQELPPEIEVELSSMIAEGAAQLFNRNVAEQRAIDIQEKLQDPVIQDNLENTAIKRLEAETRAKAAQDKTEIDLAKLIQQHELTIDKLEQDRDLTTEQIRAQFLGDILEAASRTEQIQADQAMQLTQFIMDMVKEESEGVRSELEKKVKTGSESMKLLVDLVNKSAEQEE